ncbi:Hpt domain-containing protein [Acinetobacter sp.]|uniref:hybrid sensor histidine kinase/response regulator n=1 Tax=Acinetobacter sp. TaxID=472 RepID=UPI00388DF1CE
MKEILKNLVAPMTLPEDSYLQQDAEILEIFVEEIEEIFEELSQLFQQWQDQPELLKDIRRHFHTLKGSGRMVGALQAGELAWTVEDTLNRVLNDSVVLTPTLRRYTQYVLAFYQAKLYPCFKQGKALEHDLRPLILLGQQLQQEQAIDPALLALIEQDVSLTSTTGLEHIEVEQSHSTDVLDAQYVAEDLAETLAVFIEEAEEHLATIDHFLQENVDNTPDDYNALIRALHTLRGSSSMAQIEDVFSASAKVEKLFKSYLLQEDVVSTSAETQLLRHYAEFIRGYLPALRERDQQSCHQLITEFDSAWTLYGRLVPMNEQDNPHGLVTQLLQLDIDLLLDTEVDFIERAQINFPVYLQSLTEQAERLSVHTDNRAAVGIHQYALALKSAYCKLWNKPELLNLNYAEALFNQAHVEFIHLFDTLASGQRVVLSAQAQTALQQLHDFIDHKVEQLVSFNDLPDLTKHKANSVDFAVLSQRLAQDQMRLDSDDSRSEFDLDLLDIFLEEANELFEGIDQDLNTWAKNQDAAALNNLMRYLHTLKGGANMVQANHIGLIAHELESIYERVIQGQLAATAPMIKIIQLVQDNIAERLELIQTQHIDYPADQAVDILRNIESLAQGDATLESPVEAQDQQAEMLADQEKSTIQDTDTQQPVAQSDEPTLSSGIEQIAAVPQAEMTVEATPQEIQAQPTSVLEESATLTSDTSDTSDTSELTLEQIVEQSFYEEAIELLERTETLLSFWLEQRSNRSLLLQLQRAAHSLKGGARMAQIEPIAQIAYELETVFEQLAVHQVSSNVHDSLLESTVAWLKRAIYEHDYSHVDALVQRLSSIEYANSTVKLPSHATQVDFFTPQQEEHWIQGDGTTPPSMQGEWQHHKQSDQSTEMIRISADLVEKMIDLSGENAINRSRIEMDLAQLGNFLNEMDLTIHRLADQLRRMEGELESQILAKHSSDEHSLYEDFDPLEMDQYSSLNQLSKSLSESASDLVDFKVTLSEKIRDAEGLLLQQSRIQSEIQESLMRTRLVPFTGMLPRLQRIVRTTSSALNRPAELVVYNTEGELDRTILERLITPFEHMLRNAVDHGIESPEERLKLGKPEVGQIELNISRQGTDVVVSFSDDGKGIDANKIRAKAENLGLIGVNQKLDQQEIIQFIFHPGFSTAQQVTQISGRGVGLDVVQSEIRELGGHVTVESVLGEGTTFSIRVPTTVAVSDALMVKVGDQQFALPLAQIDRIVRIAPSALEAYFASDADHFSIDHVEYKLRYLSEFVGHQNAPRLNNMGTALPVLLIKGSAGQSIALLVDQLIGSRSQIVVKSIGQQFSKVGVIAGATILGDGQVCLILDGQNIARQVQTSLRDTSQMQNSRDFDTTDKQSRLVMIVDDSVTVRKVTSRLLERHGYEVMTAKDGVDAMEQLENSRPDLMLLDIEMPRMDGFEVTNLVRHHEIHHDLPIIMITSRTGEKHRERAMSLGVNHYMGKPFQEAELLAQVQTLLLASA